MISSVSFSQFTTKFINDSKTRQHGILATNVWVVAQTIEKISKVSFWFFMVGALGTGQTFLFKESLRCSRLYICGSFALALAPKIFEQRAKNFLYGRCTVANLSRLLAPKTQPEISDWSYLQVCYQNIDKPSSIITAWSLGFLDRESARKYLATAITIYALHDILNLQWRSPKQFLRTSHFFLCAALGKGATPDSSFDNQTKAKLLVLFAKAERNEQLLPDNIIPYTIAMYDHLF